MTHLVSLTTDDRELVDDKHSDCTVPISGRGLHSMKEFRVLSASVPLSAHTFDEANRYITGASLTQSTFDGRIQARVTRLSTFGSSPQSFHVERADSTFTIISSMEWYPDRDTHYTADGIIAALNNASNGIGTFSHVPHQNGYAVMLSLPSHSVKTWTQSDIRGDGPLFTPHLTMTGPDQTDFVRVAYLNVSSAMREVTSSVHTLEFPKQIYTKTSLAAALSTWASGWGEITSQTTNPTALFSSSDTWFQFENTNLSVQWVETSPAYKQMGGGSFWDVVAPSNDLVPGPRDIGGVIPPPQTVRGVEFSYPLSIEEDYTRATLMAAVNALTSAYFSLSAPAQTLDRYQLTANAAFRLDANNKLGLVARDYASGTTHLTNIVRLDSGNVRVYLASSLYHHSHTSNNSRARSDIICSVLNKTEHMSGLYVHYDEPGPWLSLSGEGNVQSVPIRTYDANFRLLSTHGMPIFVTLEFR